MAGCAFAEGFWSVVGFESVLGGFVGGGGALGASLAAVSVVLPAALASAVALDATVLPPLLPKSLAKIEAITLRSTKEFLWSDLAVGSKGD